MNSERKNNSWEIVAKKNRHRAYLLLAICICVEIALLAFAFIRNTREDWFVFLIAEALLLVLFQKFFWIKINGLFKKDVSGFIIAKKDERTIDRKGAVGGLAYTNWERKTEYYLVISPSPQGEIGDDDAIKVFLPSKDCFLSYEVGDEVLYPAFMMLPIITSRVPKRQICPSCAHLIHMEDGACHRCGLSQVYPPSDLDREV